MMPLRPGTSHEMPSEACLKNLIMTTKLHPLFGSKEHAAVALRAAEESLVLLKRNTDPEYYRWQRQEIL